MYVCTYCFSFFFEKLKWMFTQTNQPTHQPIQMSEFDYAFLFTTAATVSGLFFLVSKAFSAFTLEVKLSRIESELPKLYEYTYSNMQTMYEDISCKFDESSCKLENLEENVNSSIASIHQKMAEMEDGFAKKIADLETAMEATQYYMFQKEQLQQEEKECIKEWETDREIIIVHAPILFFTKIEPEFLYCYKYKKNQLLPYGAVWQDGRASQARL